VLRNEIMAPSTEDHLSFLRQALDLARKSPPKSTNFRVGALLVSYPDNDASSAKVLSTGYTLELEGNTHAEQCALAKLALEHSIPESLLCTVLTSEANVTLYTTLEPCGVRLSGNTPCVQRIIATRNPSHSIGGIRKVIFGAKEPGTFVKDSESCRMMTEAGIEWQFIEGLENEILAVAKEGHKQETNVDNITEEERRRQEAIPRNPKKRMMEVPIEK
jgi:pyrimidine deaminase RibD-like protein